MSSKTRNAEKRRERVIQDEQDEIERQRLLARSMYERIEDARDVHDIKEILHTITEHLEIES